MKKNLLTSLFLLILVVFQTFIANSQTCDKCVGKNEQITFLGIDYSILSFEGTLEESDHSKVINGHFQSWNEMFNKEAKKYDIAKNFGLNQVTIASDFFEKSNLKSKNINDTRKQPITDETIKKHVQQLKLSGITTPYALFFIAVNYNKAKENATHYVVLWDTKSKKILGLQKVDTAPGGFGFRNYWAASFYNILKKENKQFKNWFK